MCGTLKYKMIKSKMTSKLTGKLHRKAKDISRGLSQRNAGRPRNFSTLRQASCYSSTTLDAAYARVITNLLIYLMMDATLR